MINAGNGFTATHCNILRIAVGNSENYLINDIETNKKIALRHDFVPAENLWTSVFSMIRTCEQKTKALPGTIVFIGLGQEKDDSIEYGWTNVVPIVSMIGSASFICYADISGGEIELFDVLTNKIIKLDDLDQNEDLKRSVTTFKQNVNMLDYMKNGDKRVIVSGLVSSYDKNAIVLSAKDVAKSGDMTDLYFSEARQILSAVDKMLDNNDKV